MVGVALHGALSNIAGCVPLVSGVARGVRTVKPVLGDLLVALAGGRHPSPPSSICILLRQSGSSFVKLHPPSSSCILLRQAASSFVGQAAGCGTALRHLALHPMSSSGKEQKDDSKEDSKEEGKEDGEVLL
jgi:zinc transporter ZupT